MLNYCDLKEKLESIAQDGKIEIKAFRNEFFRTEKFEGVNKTFHFIIVEDGMANVIETDGLIDLGTLNFLDDKKRKEVREEYRQLMKKAVAVLGIFQSFDSIQASKEWEKKWALIHETYNDMSDKSSYLCRFCYVYESEDEYQFKMCDEVRNGLQLDTENHHFVTFKKTEVPDFKEKAQKLIS